MKQESLDLLMDMIREYPYSDDIAAINRNVAKLKKYMEENGINCSITDVRGRHVLYATVCPGENPDYLLNAHMDVVPVVTKDQKEPVIKDGYLYGRGSHDCLSSVICIAELLMNIKGKVKAAAFFSMDEELGGDTAKAMIEKGLTANKAVIIIDGAFKKIIYAQKGIISLKLIANGKGGHSSAPWLFDNPVDRLLDGYFRLRSCWQQPTELNVWQNSLAATVISGGAVTNQIPDTAELMLNIRYTQMEDFDTIMRLVREKTGLQVQLLRQSDPVSVSPENPELLRLKACYEASFPGEKIKSDRMNGATDARHCAKLGIPAIVIGLEGDGAHAGNEYCALASIDKIRDVLMKYLTEK